MIRIKNLRERTAFLLELGDMINHIEVLEACYSIDNNKWANPCAHILQGMMRPCCFPNGTRAGDSCININGHSNRARAHARSWKQCWSQ